MNNPAKPILAITMGDPAGTGPEIIAKAVSGRARTIFRAVVMCRRRGQHGTGFSIN